jgi:hypothetical protein
MTFQKTFMTKTGAFLICLIHIQIHSAEWFPLKSVFALTAWTGYASSIAIKIKDLHSKEIIYEKLNAAAKGYKPGQAPKKLLFHIGNRFYGAQMAVNSKGKSTLAICTGIISSPELLAQPVDISAINLSSLQPNAFTCEYAIPCQIFLQYNAALNTQGKKQLPSCPEEQKLYRLLAEIHPSTTAPLLQKYWPEFWKTIPVTFALTCFTGWQFYKGIYDLLYDKEEASYAENEQLQL